MSSITFCYLICILYCLIKNAVFLGRKLLHCIKLLIIILARNQYYHVPKKIREIFRIILKYASKSVLSFRSVNAVTNLRYNVPLSFSCRTKSSKNAVFSKIVNLFTVLLINDVRFRRGAKL